MLVLRMHLGLFGAVCWFASAAQVRVGCFVPLLAVWGLAGVLPFFVLLVRARGPALCLGVCLLGFPAVVCAGAPIPTIASLCSMKQRKREAVDWNG